MRIFLISNMYPTREQPGYGIFVKNIADGLTQFTDVKVVTKAIIARRGKSVASKFFKYIRLYFDIVVRFFMNYDAIFLHYPNQVVPLMRLLYVFKRPLLIINFHGEDLLFDDYNRWLGKQTMKFARYASALIVPSDYFREEAIRRGLPPSKIHVSPSGGIDESLFSPAEIRKHSRNELHLGFIGRLEEGKGVYEFMDAVDRLNIPVRATVIGYGPLLDEVESRANDKLRVIGGVLQNELPRFYSDFDLFVFPTKRREESLGLTGIESMACGTPVIGSDIGGIPTYLQDGYNGYLVRPGSVNDLVEAIEKYARLSDTHKKQMQEHCLTTSLSFYRSAVARRLAEIFIRVGQEEIC